MNLIKPARALGLALGTLTVCAGPAVGEPAFRSLPGPGAHSYVYEVREITGEMISGYRTTYRLRSDGRGGFVADILASQVIDGTKSTPVAVDADCAKALHAKTGELAEIRLSPLTPEAAKMGDAFLPSCAPAGVFFPLTDILNVVLIQASDKFRLGSLRRVGDAAAYPGFATDFDRLGMAFSEQSSDGRIVLKDLTANVATVDWTPSPSRMDMVQTHNGAQTKLDGTETFGFRLAIDARSGWLRHAETLFDDLDLAMTMAGVPADKLPRLKTRRVVTIDALPQP